MLLVTLGLAWLTELAGLSLALGAFLAGMLISETEYRYQVDDDIKPFRDVLLGLFFVTIGMLLDLAAGARAVAPGAAAAGGAASLAEVRADRLAGAAVRQRPARCAAHRPVRSRQAGEFGFVLLTLAARRRRWSPPQRLQRGAGRRWCCRCWPRRCSSSTADRIVLRFVVERLDCCASMAAAPRSRRRRSPPRRTSSSAATAAAARTWRACSSARASPYIALDARPRPRARRPPRPASRVVFGDAARLRGCWPRRPGARQRGGGDLRRHAVGAEDPAATCASMRRERAGDRAHRGRHRRGQAARGRCGRDRGRGGGGLLMLATQTMMLLGVPLNRVLQQAARGARRSATT
ncbi:MAG: cation:proton antiporter [Comamonadaceae bacterium]|nr:cation:proton antiporter [Comamonadaceae bacterium]